jgi:hypothetical protein
MSAHNDSTVPPPIRWLSPAIAAPVRYRVVKGEWLSATVIEIGRLAVVIRTPHRAPPLYTPVELCVMVAGAEGAPPREIACSGRVVRIGGSSRTGARLIAVAIDD